MKDTIYSHFRHWVHRRPDEICIIDNKRAWTFRQVDALSARIAHALSDLRGRCIGVVMDHGAHQIAVLLGILRSGNTYVPAEPSLPHDRIDYMMQTANVAAIIDDDWIRNRLPDSSNRHDLSDKSEPDMPAYILFTSGTSGRPKGVIVENKSVVNYAEAFRLEMDVTPDDRMLQLSVCSFDIFVEEVFASLLNGASLAIPPHKIISSVRSLMSYCRRTGVTMISGFPYLLAEINKLSSLPPTIRLLISGGDVLRASYITNLKNRGVKIYNTYGPSETTVCATYSRVDNAEPLTDGTYPIGYPIHGVKVMLLDKDFNPVAENEAGEICILGAGVGKGYIGNPPEQRNFTNLPDGRRVYRSGDLGYRLPDGEFGFLHRIDDQVMILGKRVEPAEVENVLNASPDVERGVVRAFLDNHGLNYLVAYFVPGNGSISTAKIKRWLASKLSDFMVPEYLVSLKNIPLTRRGKVDVSALPKIDKKDRTQL